MLHVRGNRIDYDSWARLGCRGWSFEEVLPYFRKSEHFEDARAEASGNTRGVGGDLNVARMRERAEVLDAVVGAAVHEGFAENEDYNNGRQEGFGYFQVNQKNGERCSSARAFLHPVVRRPNLEVLTGAMATRVLLQGRKAVGVEFVRDGRQQQALAAREVILAAGAVKSPHLLELSGIGRGELLQSIGIQVCHDLPGVGENYRDHYAPRMSWRIRRPITLNEQTRGLSLLRGVVQYYTQRRGVLTWAPGMVFGFVKTDSELPEPDVQFCFAHASYAAGTRRVLDREPGLTLTVYQCRPESVGSIHARSPDALAAPAIRPNYLSNERDRAVLLAGMKIGDQVMASPAMDEYRAFRINPGESVNTDDEWLDFARRNGQTTFHVAGTCKMGHDAMAVVDDRLRVHGMDGLRVVDASIMPTMVSGNTNATVVMIAEKGAEMIRSTRG
jgi:choline dehydrogenase